MKVEKIIVKNMIDSLKTIRKYFFAETEDFEGNTSSEFVYTIILDFLENLLVGSRVNYFCILQEFKFDYTCITCPYALFHGICTCQDSDHFNIAKQIDIINHINNLLIKKLDLNIDIEFVQKYFKTLQKKINMEFIYIIQQTKLAETVEELTKLKQKLLVKLIKHLNNFLININKASTNNIMLCTKFCFETLQKLIEQKYYYGECYDVDFSKVCYIIAERDSKDIFFGPYWDTEVDYFCQNLPYKNIRIVNHYQLKDSYIDEFSIIGRKILT
jgi:hypothetical protein